MKRIVAALIVVIMCFMLSACSFPTYKTPLMWCVLDVLHNEPYADGEAVDGWQYEKLNLTYKENEYYNEYCYIRELHRRGKESLQGGVMPIKPENRGRYPANWKEIRAAILKRADNKCEFCGIKNYAVRDGSRVVLTIAHLDHTPEHNSPDNLRALCQRCHNRYDAKHRSETRRSKHD